MEPVIIDAGTLEFSEEDLTATGLLVPFGVKARSNLGEFDVQSGVFSIPADPTGMSLNIEHKREDVAGAVAKVWEQPEGIMGTFKFSDTELGRSAFADAKSGKRKNLSAEVAEVCIVDGAAVSGRLFAGALVERPAFEGATLLAAEDTPSSESYESPEAASSSQYVTEFTDSNGVKWRRIETNTSTTTVEKVDGEETSEATPAEEHQEGGSTVTATATEPGQTPAAVVPGTLLAGEPAAPEQQDVDLRSLFAAMADVKSGIATEETMTLLAALSDIKVNTTGGLTTAASGVTQPAWVGKLWQGRRYKRRYLDLLTHNYGGIQLGGRKGFNLDQGTALVTKWNGNKSEIGSGVASTSVRSSTRQAYGYAADVAREWYDLEGGAEVIQAFFEGVFESYAKVTDLDALATIFDVATKGSTALDRLIAPLTYPGVDGHDYAGAMGMVIQAVEQVYDDGDDASFAIVNPVAWRELLYTPKDLVPEYVDFSIGLAAESASAAGKVRIVKAPASAFVGLDPADPQVIAGAKGAIEFREQSETPIQVDALDIAKGGVDKAVLGYLETFVVRPASLVAVGTAAA